MKMILMSRDNPAGVKLEDLLQNVRLEVEGKNLKIAMDQTDVAKTVFANNARISALLKEAEELQRASLTALNAIAPDPGPRGKPRIGE